jgi:hypothetical protein
MTMTEHDERQNTWGKPPAAFEKQEHSERRYSVMSNLMTLLFTGLIIAGGFLLPTLLYPYLDLYRDDTFHLARPSDNALAGHVFNEPAAIYPWNIYESEERSLRSLSTTERDLLDIRGIPDFLLATLRDHGLQAEEDEGGLRARILNAFRYLEPNNGIDPGCFVLGEAGSLDIDGDERADLRCAVDSNGNVISLIFTSSQWESVQIEAPIGVAGLPPTSMEQTTETPAADEGEGTGGAAGEGEGEGAGGTGGAGAGGTEGEEGAEGTGADGAEGAEGTTETPAADDTGGADANTATQPRIEHLPVEEDRDLWSFVYATAREAQIIGQTELFSAFRQLELTYEYRYGYPFTALLPVQPAEPEELPEVTYVALTPSALMTEDYLLSIYDLPSGERLVLYLNPSNLHCMGFNLLRY